MARALDGVVVLDLTGEFWAALGATLLGDFGAEVIRVETLPEARRSRMHRGDDEPEAPWDFRFELANRNKLSLAVDLGTPAGHEVLEKLVAGVDIFVTDWLPSKLRAQKLDYESLARIKGDLIFGHASGFGPKGPDAELPPLDELAAARTGMMPILGQPGLPPVYPGHGHMYSSVMLAFGVASALYHRHATGEGQEVNVSAFAGNMYGASLDLQAFLAMGGDRFLHPVSRLDAGNPMSGTLYPTSDGLWVTLTMPDTDRYWQTFAQVVDLDPDDPRFNSHARRCEDNRLELMRILEERFPRHSADHWRKTFAEKQLSADVIEQYEFPDTDEQTRRNRYILDLLDPNLGPIKTLGFPIHMSETPARLDRRAPSLGQHSADILHRRLGYPEDRIVKLQQDGVIA